ncbi:unnamed protein product [Lota lota]
MGFKKKRAGLQKTLLGQRVPWLVKSDLYHIIHYFGRSFDQRQSSRSDDMPGGHLIVISIDCVVAVKMVGLQSQGVGANMDTHTNKWCVFWSGHSWLAVKRRRGGAGVWVG